MWMTLGLSKEKKKKSFLQHINSVYLAIKFTVEDNKEDGTIPFLDTIVKPEADGKPSITVYRKPTHMNQYLQWDSHHCLSAKYGVINTLTHMAKTVCNKPELFQNEMEDLRKALIHWQYPKWSLDRVEKRLTNPTRDVSNGADSQGTAGNQPTTNEVKPKGHIVIPYTQGLCESIKKISSRYNIQTNF